MESEDVELLGQEGRKIHVKVGGISEGGESIEENDQDEEKGKGMLKG